MEELNRILIIDPNNVKARTDIAVMLLSAKKLQQASKEIDCAMVLDSSFIKAKYYKAVIAHQLGDNVTAKKLFGELAELEHENYGTMAKVYIEKYLI